ncbi:MAG TPA: hypothetical protein VK187_07005 [Geobacteraceae bacterium]|nr:hypothetical protein [Geobacteraceae bacterium]
MVLLVRCKDNTCSVALKSCLNDLVREGLVTAYLRNGEWVAVEKTRTGRVCRTPEQSKGLLSPLVANF